MHIRVILEIALGFALIRSLWKGGRAFCCHTILRARTEGQSCGHFCVFPGSGPEDVKGYHSIRVNRQWRLVFQWDGSRGEASEVNPDDHSYR